MPAYANRLQAILDALEIGDIETRSLDQIDLVVFNRRCSTLAFRIS